MSQQITNDKAASKWEVVERVSKTLSMLAIPIVLAIGGWGIQKYLQDQTLNRDYVALAVSILKEPKDSAKIDPERRIWAVQLLNDNSPRKFNPQVLDQLQSGKLEIPASFNVSQPAPAATPSSGSTREQAGDLELKGFTFLLEKDVDAALQAFTAAEKSWPTYHSVAEIRKLLADSRNTLIAAPKDGKSEAWSNLYRTLLTKYSWGMPDEVKKKLSEQQ